MVAWAKPREALTQVDDPFDLQKELRGHLTVIEHKIDRLLLKVGRRPSDVQATDVDALPARSPSRPGSLALGAWRRPVSPPPVLQATESGASRPGSALSGVWRRPTSPAVKLQAWGTGGLRPPSALGAARTAVAGPELRPPSALCARLPVATPEATWTKGGQFPESEKSEELEELQCSRRSSEHSADSKPISQMEAAKVLRPGGDSLRGAARARSLASLPSEGASPRAAPAQAFRRRDRRASTAPSITVAGSFVEGEEQKDAGQTGNSESARPTLRRSSTVSGMSGFSSEHAKLGRLRSFMRLPLEEKKSEGFGHAIISKLGLKQRDSKGKSGGLELAAAQSSPLWRMVHGNYFQFLCSFMIVLNVFLIGVMADAQLKSELRGEPENPIWEYVDRGFASFFALELVVRLAAEGRYFIWGPEWKWNLFDSVLVMLSVLDVAMLYAFGSGGMSNMSAGRILRFVRFIRIVRIARAVRAFHSLRLVVYAIFESMLSLVWCFLVVFLIIYTFAVFFLYGVTEHVRFGGADDPELEVLISTYGSVPRAIVTLFMTISGGVDWRDAVEPLIAINWLYEPVFNFYVFFMVIGVLNVVVGAFVATTADISARDRDFLVKNEISQIQTYTRKVQTFFKEADKDRSGCLSWEEFKEYLKVPKVSAYFRALELDVGQAHLVFRLLDGDGSNEVNLDEFLQGCMRLKGPAKSLDMNMMLYENKRLQNKLDDFMWFVSEELECQRKNPHHQNDCGLELSAAMM